MSKRTLAERHPRTAALLVSVFLMLLAVLAATPPAGAAVCSKGNVPGATLLVPYFEVDLADPGGKTTLFSIGNAAAEPTLAKVVVWTDWGFPAFDFFVHLGPDAVQTINLRDVIGRLAVPSLAGADPGDFPGCFVPQAPIAGPTPAELQAKLTGKPNADNICHGSARGETTIAVGFVTVDVVRDCDLLVGGATPLDDEYVDLAEDDNVLFGDVFYVDPDDDSAQGIAAVAIRSGLELPPSSPYSSPFYPLQLDRISPDERWRTRFLSGGAVGADTELVVWIDNFVWKGFPDGFECGSYDLDVLFPMEYAVSWGTEAGPLPEPTAGSFVPVKAVTRKLALAELLPGELPVGGVLALEVWQGCFRCPFILGGAERLPSVVFPVLRAAGRFSVAIEATPIAGNCSDSTP